MTSLRSLVLGTALTASAVALATPAAAADYLFDFTGDSHTLYFDGFGGDPVVNIPGLTSSLQLTLTGGLDTDTLSFSYVLTNTSIVGGPTSEVSGFAFSSTPPVDPETGNGDPTGTFGNINVSGTYPNGIGGVEVCLTGNSGAACAGGGGSGATLVLPATGSFDLVYDSTLSSVTLNDFFVRYQSLTGLGNITSATGRESLDINPNTGPVPEPATWAMLLIGFGAIGATMRSRKSAGGRRMRIA